jgi:hypothetical protein
MIFQPKLKKTLIRVLSASILAAAISLISQYLIGTPDSVLVNLIAASGFKVLSIGFVIPWIVPEIRELLAI